MTEIYWAGIEGGRMGEIHKVADTAVWRGDVREYLRLMHPEIDGDEIYDGIDDGGDASFAPFWEMETIVNVHTVCRNDKPWQLWFAGNEEFEPMFWDETKVQVRYDFGPGEHFGGMVNSMTTLWEPGYDFEVYAECLALDSEGGVPTFYGYAALKEMIRRAFAAKGCDADRLVFQFDGHEDMVEDTAIDPVDVFVEVRQSRFWPACETEF